METLPVEHWGNIHEPSCVFRRPTVLLITFIQKAPVHASQHALQTSQSAWRQLQQLRVQIRTKWLAHVFLPHNSPLLPHSYQTTEVLSFQACPSPPSNSPMYLTPLPSVKEPSSNTGQVLVISKCSWGGCWQVWVQGVRSGQV